MKSFLILSTIFLLHISTYGQNPIKDGEYKEFYPNGNLKMQGFYKNRKADSTWIFYFSDGKIFKTGNYKDCLYNLGYIKALISVPYDYKWHEKGRENGLWKIYYPNGLLQTEYQIICGTKVGLEKRFDTTGRIIEESFYSNGNLLSQKEFHQNGALFRHSLFSYYSVKERKKGNYYLTFSKTAVSEFYENGSLEKIYYEDDKGYFGEYKEFWENGFLQREANYKQGEENGVVKEFYENGFLESETEYKMGKKHGKSFLLNPDGEVREKQIWKNGVLNKKIKLQTHKK
ncbi:hypothetical protein AD998_09055 [bacterium 336/3]|nr:hypothetical protein AD998_09055 [bacterium 336/3]